MGGGSNDRLRFSCCVDAKTMFGGANVSEFTDKNIKLARGSLDELCWLRTVINSQAKVDTFETEVPALKIASVWKKMSDACKDQHVQLMVGFAHASTFITDRAKTFLNWLYADAPSPTLSAWATSLRSYCAKNFPGMNGISFDLENLSLSSKPLPKADTDADKRKAEIKRRGQRWSEFYVAVAKAFANEGWMVGAFLKPKISDTNGTSTLRDDTVGLHLYEMAKGQDNLILRPMAYEANPPEGMSGWFGAICDYAVGTPQSDGTLKGGKCGAENFQLTLKVSSSRNPGQVVTDDAGRVVPELGIVPPSPTVIAACKTVFRPHLTGICLFPGGGGVTFWKDINAALNSNTAGSMKGWPKQFPLAKDPADAFRK